MSGIDVPATVNRFIAVCRDGQRLYEEAAAKVDRPDLADHFRNMAKLREEVIDRLSPHVEARDEDITDRGTVSGTTHRLLTEIQTSLASDKEQALIPQLEEAEKLWLAELRKITEDPVPDPVRQVMADALGTFESTATQIESLRRKSL